MNMGIIIIIAVAGLWALGIFLGLIGGISKTFTHVPAAIDSSSIKSQEQKTIEDTEEKRQKLMDDMKQKIQDAGQKY
jgi:hypothetical protein